MNNKEITVKELIEKLSGCDPDKVVLVYNGDYHGFDTINGIDEEKEFIKIC